MRRHHQVIVTADVGDALGEVGFFASQQSREGVLGEGIRHRSYGSEGRGRIGAQRHGDGVGLSGPLQLPVPKIQRATAMR